MRPASNIVAYRSVDGRILSVYWADGPSGLDDLSGTAGTPPAAGDPVGYYTPHDDTHQIVYRGNDNHLYELYWPNVAPVAGWNLTASAGAPPAVGTPARSTHAPSNVKHVIYRSADGGMHQLWWVPGGGAPTWVNLTSLAGAPPAADGPAAFATDTPWLAHAAYRGNNGHIYEIMW